MFKGQRIIMSQAPTVPSSRRDAQKNRAHILDVARRAFDSEGVDISMDAIAKRAGVGPGTLYRHFPNKDALLAALLVVHFESLEDRRAEIEVGQNNAGQVLELWIEALGDWMQAYDGLPEPLRAACGSESALTPTCRDVIGTTDRILKAAQDEGFARRSITGRDVFLGALAIAWASGTETAGDETRDVLRDVLKYGWELRALA